MPLFPWRDLDQHHVPWQHQPAGGPLQVPQEQRGLPPQETRLQHWQRSRIPVQFCLLPSNCKCLENYIFVCISVDKSIFTWYYNILLCLPVLAGTMLDTAAHSVTSTSHTVLLCLTISCQLQFSHSLFSLSEIKMSTQRTLSPVFSQKVGLTCRGGWRDHVKSLLMSTQSQMSQAPPGHWRGTREGVQWRWCSHLQWLLYVTPLMISLPIN